MQSSFVYIMTNKNRSVLYIGVTASLIKRIEEHKNRSGSNFAKKYNCTDLIYFEEFTDVNQAIVREKQLKNWHREWKWNLIREKNPELIDLYNII